MPMTFEVSKSVTLLFDFWHVNSPGGMFVSVLVVMLLTVFYELLKVWRVWLSRSTVLVQYSSPYGSVPSQQSDSRSVLENTPSESSMTPNELHPVFPRTRRSLLLHGVQTLLHLLQVTLGYMLMLCIMSFNTWIFLGIIAGSALGYFISFPLLDQH
ncbi:probable low affinity copper uptake protein 2 [Syngnathoides biaculeatus]|uniref:probable low affinity copper uptake protein 2 n=1 Tax=Syngnathoides biaculeatus TaxID=300417 RepID=UPI002ADD44B9|nr:probable low affinity copper uptake protein 2 [Syngnathoides biaculeatus]